VLAGGGGVRDKGRRGGERGVAESVVLQVQLMPFLQSPGDDVPTGDGVG
jgi:hypothetical protein